MPAASGDARAAWRLELARARLAALALRRSGRRATAALDRATAWLGRSARAGALPDPDPTALLAALMARGAAGQPPAAARARVPAPPATALRRNLRLVGAEGGAVPASSASRQDRAGVAGTHDAAAATALPATSPAGAAAPSAGIAAAAARGGTAPAASLAERRAAARALRRRGGAASAGRGISPANPLSAARVVAAISEVGPEPPAGDDGFSTREEGREPPAAARDGAEYVEPGEAEEGGRGAPGPFDPAPGTARRNSPETQGADDRRRPGPDPSSPARSRSRSAFAPRAPAERVAGPAPGPRDAEDRREPPVIPELPPSETGITRPSGPPGPRTTLEEEEPLEGLVHRHGADPSWP